MIVFEGKVIHLIVYFIYLFIYLFIYIIFFLGGGALVELSFAKGNVWVPMASHSNA